jgi:hypothetical protein
VVKIRRLHEPIRKAGPTQVSINPAYKKNQFVTTEKKRVRR